MHLVDLHFVTGVHACQRPCARFGLLLEEWLLARSAGRTWFATDGGEWALLASARSFICGEHALRLLAGGCRGKSGARSNAVRAAHPRRCVQCCSPAVVLSWTTPSPDFHFKPFVTHFLKPAQIFITSHQGVIISMDC